MQSSEGAVVSDEREHMERFLELYREDPTRALREFLADDAVFRHWRWGEETLTGREHIDEAYLSRLDDAYADLTFEIEDTIMDENTLVVRMRFHGTFREDFHAVRATGKPATWRAHDILRFRDGKIVDVWYANDTYVVAQQMGILPTGPLPWKLPETERA